MVDHLKRQDGRVGRKRVRCLMAKMGLAVIYKRPWAWPHPENRGLAVTRPDHVWCTDVTYLPMHRDFLYLVAIMDWHSCWVLSWRLSNILTDRVIEYNKWCPDVSCVTVLDGLTRTVWFIHGWGPLARSSQPWRIPQDSSVW